MLDDHKFTLKRAIHTCNCKGRILSFHEPVVMGVINVTPDSFYTGNNIQDVEAYVQQAGSMLAQGASIIDIGGQSTRPGSSRISPEEEALRVLPAIKAIRNAFPDSFISIDTFYSQVASQAVAHGADMINDISGGMLDDHMHSTVAALNVPYILMHMKGSPQSMQEQALYANVLLEVLDYFISRVSACRKAGITDIIIDPGFGFAKTTTQNFRLLREMDRLLMLDLPILAGLSRKSMIYKTLGTDASQALNGSTVLHTIALLKGASILRVHDVREAKEAISLLHSYNTA